MGKMEFHADRAHAAGWRVDLVKKVIRAPITLSLRVLVYDIYALAKSAVVEHPNLGPPALRYAPEPFPWQFALREGWAIERPEFLIGGPLYDYDGILLVEDRQPRKLAFWQIDQFAEARDLDVDVDIDPKTGLVLVQNSSSKVGEDRFVKEGKVKAAIHFLLNEPYASKDNPSELNDLFSSRVLVGGQERNTAFLLKGPGIGGPSKRRRALLRSNIDKNGTQVERLLRS